MAVVLLIEDDPQIRMVYSFALAKAGYKVIEAADASIGWQRITESQPDVVLLDMLMPGLSGLEFLKQYDIKKRYPRVKVIAFSNIETPRVVDEAKKLGASEYLLKVEVTPHQLVEVIDKLVAKKAHK